MEDYRIKCEEGYWCKALTYMNYTPDGVAISCEPGKAKTCESCLSGQSAKPPARATREQSEHPQVGEEK